MRATSCHERVVDSAWLLILWTKVITTVRERVAVAPIVINQAMVCTTLRRPERHRRVKESGLRRVVPEITDRLHGMLLTSERLLDEAHACPHVLPAGAVSP